MRRITIPNTRLEGHGRVEIFLDEDENVKDAFFQIIEFRGFEKFCEGRHVEEMPRITPKICGVCPGAHHMASAKACDAVFNLEIPKAAKKLRELYYCAHILHSHMLHFYALALPDFLLEEKTKRNLLGLAEILGKDACAEILDSRVHAQRIQELLAGHPIYPVAALPGGMSKQLGEDKREEIEDKARKLIAFSRKGLELFEEKLLQKKELAELFRSDAYTSKTYFAGLVDEKGRVNFYEGKVRVVDPNGKELFAFNPSDYLQHIAEHVEAWSYTKFPYLKSVGWKGFVDGLESGIYRVNSLARLNVADGMATPFANEAYKRMYEFFGTKPVHNLMAFHWARLIEMVYAAERMLELAQDEEITDKNVRVVPTEKPTEGIGVVEAPRGTLYHHYITDRNGIVKKVNLIVATVQNNAAINLSVKKAAQNFIKKRKAEEKLVNAVEMAVRAYDPCLACATHALGRTVFEIRMYKNGELVKVIR